MPSEESTKATPDGPLAPHTAQAGALPFLTSLPLGGRVLGDQKFWV